MGSFSADKGELSPEERIRFLEERVEILSEFEGHLFDSAMFALSKIHAIALALEGGGIVEAGEFEAMRRTTLEPMRRLEKAKGNGR